MENKYFVLRKSKTPDKEPKWFHDYYKAGNGTWQIGFFSWLFYTKS